MTEKLLNKHFHLVSPCDLDHWPSYPKIFTAVLQVIIHQLAKYKKDPMKNDREIGGRRWWERRKIKSKKEKTLQQQKGLPTLSADLNYGLERDCIDLRGWIRVVSFDQYLQNSVLWFLKRSQKCISQSETGRLFYFPISPKHNLGRGRWFLTSFVKCSSAAPEANSREYRGVFKANSREKTRQIREN